MASLQRGLAALGNYAAALGPELSRRDQAEKLARAQAMAPKSAEMKFMYDSVGPPPPGGYTPEDFTRAQAIRKGFHYAPQEGNVPIEGMDDITRLVVSRMKRGLGDQPLIDTPKSPVGMTGSGWKLNFNN